MTVDAWLLGATVMVPLACALVAVVVPRIAAVLGALTGAALLVVGVTIAVRVARDGPLTTTLGGWAEPVGIGLRADGLSAVMLVTGAAVWLLVHWYAGGSTAARGNRFFGALALLLLAGLDAVFVAADLFNTYVALELVTVAAVCLVALGGGAAIGAALRYLFVAVAGSLWFLLAVALLYADTGTLSLAQIAERSAPGVTVLAALCVATLGLALKSALVPMHAWLPPAHAGAPSAVSPLMSALVIKASLVVLVRLWTTLPLDGAAMPVAQLLGALGCLAVVWGGVAALREAHLKRVVAYSTVAQVGYFVLLVPLAAPALTVGADAADRRVAELALQGTLALVVGHALAKTAMFTAAGCLLEAHGTDRLTALRGAVREHPVPVAAFAVAGVALAGLPPAIAFSGKWALLVAALDSGQWWWVPTLVLGGVLTAAYTVRVLAVLLARPDTGPDRAARPVPPRMQRSALVAGLLAVAGGFGWSAVLALSSVGSSVGSAVATLPGAGP